MSPPGLHEIPHGCRLSGADPVLARRILVVLPGALTPLAMFRSLTANLPADTTLIELAFPGLDGRPLDHPVRIRPVARRIAAWIETTPAQRIDLVGLSAGAAIALELRGHLAHRNVTTALIAAPAPAPVLMVSALVFGGDILRIAWRHRGASRAVLWFEVFQILLLGRDPTQPPNLASDDGRPAGPSVVPTPRMLLYHGLAVAFWRPSRRARNARGAIRFFHGSNDPVSPAPAIRRMARKFPGADVILYPGRGHLPHILNPQLFDDIRRFWRLSTAG